ncbi:hypothetical protein ACWEKM_38710 [Streptomyces sp. NPDC004752]
MIAGPGAEPERVGGAVVGRTDLTPAVVTRRLEDYLEALFDRYGGGPRAHP